MAMLDEDVTGGFSRGGLTRDEREALAGFRYRDGSRMERGDVVYVADEGPQRAWKIVGWDLWRFRAVLVPVGAGSPGRRDVDPERLSRWAP